MCSNDSPKAPKRFTPPTRPPSNKVTKTGASTSTNIESSKKILRKSQENKKMMNFSTIAMVQHEMMKMILNKISAGLLCGTSASAVARIC